MNNFQDWNPVILRNKNREKEDPILLKHRNNVEIETIKKDKNKIDTNLRKLDSNDIIIIDKIPLEICKKIQQGRLEKNLTRKELAQKLNIKENIITEIENGKYKYDKQLIRKIEKILNYKIL